MASIERFNIVDKLLIAAIDLERRGKRPFSSEDLVVNAWKHFPDAFGLQGHLDENGKREYPDSNRVYSEIMGSKPIRKNGFLKKVATKMYVLTEAGQAKARKLAERNNGGNQAESSVNKSGLARTMVSQIKRLFSSKAVEKFLAQRQDEITFYDACSFWGITPRSSAIDFEGKMANFRKIVEAAIDHANGRKLSFEHGGRAYSPKELDLLLRINEFLSETFKEQIAIILKRRDERV